MKEKIIFALSLIVSVVFVFAVVSSPPGSDEKAGGITEENGVQVIRIFARNGFTPKKVTAKADMPTRLEVETKGTYDCSSVLVIPKLSYQKNLPQTGITEIEIPVQKKGSEITGLCAMGMYSFSVEFL